MAWLAAGRGGDSARWAPLRAGRSGQPVATRGHPRGRGGAALGLAPLSAEAA